MSTQAFRIVLVDDNPSDRLLAIRELNQEFAELQIEEVTDQANFEAALTLDRPDLVITDYQLRWGDGLQVLRAVKARFADCPVIMFTNSSNGELAARAMKAGLDDYVTKSPRQYIRLAGAARSAIEFARASRQATRMQLRLQGLLDQLNVGVYRASAGGVLLEFNAAFMRLLRINSPADLETLDLSALFQQPDGSNDETFWEREVQLQRLDGETIWVMLSATRSLFEREVVVEGLLEDITAAKRLLEERRRVNDDLECRVSERTAQLEAANQELEAFSYSVSHDLREPLRNMQGLAQALLEDFDDEISPAARHYAQLIVSSSQQMDTLVQDLLTYTRLGRAGLELQPVNLDGVLANALSQLEVKLRGSDTEIVIEEPLPQVLGHYNTLLQILVNLLTNAVKFVGEGVRPRINIRAEEQPAAESGAPPRVRLWVEDNGIGISPQNQQRIFGIFERLHGAETYPGTGIGLAIVRKGAERLGGRAGVESRPGEGSRFWVDLPGSLPESK